MGTWLGILLDLGILALLGVAYYYWQKRRIVRVSREEILADLESFRFQLNKFTEENPSKSELILFTNLFEDIFKQGDIKSIIDLDSNALDSELKEFYEALCKQIKDHLKITPKI